MKYKIFKRMPKRYRLWIRELPVISQILNRRAAIRYASTTKRLDQCLNEFAELYSTTGFSLHDKVCLEIGAGWVLSHALAMHVFGAKKVISSDISRLAFPDTLLTAVREAERFIDWEKLEKLGNVALMKSRFEHLMSIDAFTIDQLADLGIEYKAPINISQRTLGQPVDFIFSHAVMEHVPVDYALPLLTNLVADLTENGAMCHGIHLEDHEDKDAPFAFFSETAKAYTPSIQSARGNRIRKSGWTSILSKINGISYKYIMDLPRTDVALPDTIDPSVEYTDELDLRSAHLQVWVVKLPK